MAPSRRQFLAGGLASAAPVVLSARRAARPNILWISCEDTSPTLGCFGDPQAITPALDKLASEGVCYTRAYTVAGVCAPSRSGIITGMFPSTLGSHHMRCQAKLPAHVKCFPEYLREAGYYCTNNSKTDYNFPVPPKAWDESSGKAHYRHRAKGQPFFAVFNITTTHESRILIEAEKFRGLTARLTASQRRDPARMRVPAFHPDTPVTRRQWANYYELVTAMDYEVADRLKELENDGLLEDTIVFFWGDHGTGLPRAKRWLYESGTHAPIIVRIPEKFRTAGQGEPGTRDSQLVSFLDLGPTVLNLAGVEVPKHMQSRAFLGPNLTPPREYVYGARDRMDERYDIIRAVRDRRYRYIRNYEPFKPYYQYMNTSEQSPVMQDLRRAHAEGALRPAAAQFMADRKPEEELYDVERDPDEVRNLAALPGHRKTLERLRAAHEAWTRETRDLGLIPEPELVEREEKLGSRYAILRQPDSDALLTRLREMAAAAARGERERLERGIKDPDAAVRYWAATGLGNLDASAPGAALEAALKDSSAAVRVAAARGLLRAGSRQEAALKLLTVELASPREWVRLAAALALDESGAKARPAADALRRALEDKNNYVPRVARHALAGMGA